MKHEEQLQGQIAQRLTRFAEVHLQVKPHRTWVDIHTDSVVVTLENIIPWVERDYARDNQGHELLGKSYAAVYACIRHMAEIELKHILDRGIYSSMMQVDLDSGNAFLVFNLCRGTANALSDVSQKERHID